MVMTIDEFLQKINSQVCGYKIIAEPSSDGSSVCYDFQAEFMGTKVSLYMWLEGSRRDREFANIADDFISELKHLDRDRAKQVEKLITPIAVQGKDGRLYSRIIIGGEWEIPIIQIDTVVKYVDAYVRDKLGQKFLRQKSQEIIEQLFAGKYRKEFEAVAKRFGYDIKEVSFGPWQFMIVTKIMLARDTDTKDLFEYGFSTRVTSIEKLIIKLFETEENWSAETTFHSEGLPPEMIEELDSLVREFRKEFRPLLHEVRLNMLKVGIEPYIAWIDEHGTVRPGPI